MARYIEPTDADGYFLTRFNRSEWLRLDETQKQQLLNEATVLIDSLNYAGDRTDSEQELEFPRSGDTEVPQQIKDACCEIAYATGVGGRDIELENLMVGDSSVNIGPGRMSVTYIEEGRLHAIPSAVAWRLLRPFLRDGSTVSFNRTN